MVFRNFYWRIAFRLGLLILSLLVFSFCIVNELYLRSVYLGVLVLILTVELFYFLTRFTENIKMFLIGVQQKDFSFHFEEKEGSFQGLYRELNKVTSSFKQITEEREVQHRFLEMVVEHIRIGIICLDATGKIYLVNNAFRKLIGKKEHQKFTLNSLTQSLVDEIINLRSGETKSVNYCIENSTKTFALYASDFRLQSNNYKLISIQDISSELSLKEQESYLKLMRVLTHEIMNSMAPIVSLSDTLYRMAEKEFNETNSSPVLASLITGLEAIRSRSNSLHQFTESYRQLSRIPNPKLEKIDIKLVLEKVVTVFSQELKNNAIDLQLLLESFELSLDKNLMEQAILNLLKNAVESASENDSARIQITGTQTEGTYKLEIADNGPGIDNEDLERIFVPFFTTKKNGTGIGLAIVRQIIQLHGGEISVVSIPNERTTFTITF